MRQKRHLTTAHLVLLAAASLSTLASANTPQVNTSQAHTSQAHTSQIDAPQMRAEIKATSIPTGANILVNKINALPTPKTAVGNIEFIKTITIPQTKNDEHRRIDVTLLDDFIEDISPNARHYPPNFPTRTTEYQAKQIVTQLSEWLEPYANAPDASFDVLLRAVKINSMARNLDLGSEFGVRASTYVARALAITPNHPEANFLYGMMLAEGGGFKEGEKYLQKAASLGYVEAEQSLAQSDLLSDNRQAALARLQRLQSAHPNHPQLATQIDIINNGGFYIWDIKDSNLNIKPNQ